MNQKNPKVDAFLERAARWREEFVQLRKIILAHGVVEELKWGKPCYSLQESNLFILQGFKDYCALMFCKGALLADPRGLLAKPGEHTQAGRQLRFTSVRQIGEMTETVQAYVREAIEAQKAGLKVEFKVNPEPVPAELRKKFNDMPALRTAFQALTPGRQRGYILYFSGAKQAKTREVRIENHLERILGGKGLNDE